MMIYGKSSYTGTCVFQIFLVTFVFSLPLSQSQRTCSDIDHFTQLHRNSFLMDVEFLNMTTGSLLTCVKQCNVRRRCVSFNFDMTSGLCFLNEKSRNETYDSDLVNMQGYVFSDIESWPESVSGACAHHNCSRSSVCSPVSETEYECKTLYCVDPPPVPNSREIDNAIRYWNINDTVDYECDVGYNPVGLQLCQPDGSWSHFACLRIASCVDLKVCNADYKNGEYWLRPTLADRRLLKVFCHGMTRVPKDYITINGETYSYFLDSDITDCDAHWNGTHEGITVFEKIKISMEYFGLQRSGIAFATTNGTYGPVGKAGDCRLKSACSAQQSGSFRIDTTGTGVKIVPYATWNNETTITRLNNGTIILGECLGGCNLCKGQPPGFENGVFKLEYDTDFEPDLTTATFPTCKV